MPPPFANRKKPFYKTKMCPWFFKGRCDRRGDCLFAHSPDELREAPDLSKTSMCPNIRANGCCEEKYCTFAHQSKELRHTRDLYKTAMCIRYSKGHCTAGDQCRHAHGDHEIQRASIKYFGTEEKAIDTDENNSTVASSTANQLDDMIVSNPSRNANLSSLQYTEPNTTFIRNSKTKMGLSRSRTFANIESALVSRKYVDTVGNVDRTVCHGNSFPIDTLERPGPQFSMSGSYRNCLHDAAIYREELSGLIDKDKSENGANDDLNCLKHLVSSEILSRLNLQETELDQFPCETYGEVDNTGISSPNFHEWINALNSQFSRSTTSFSNNTNSSNDGLNRFYSDTELGKLTSPSNCDPMFFHNTTGISADALSYSLMDAMSNNTFSVPGSRPVSPASDVLPFPSSAPGSRLGSPTRFTSSYPFSEYCCSPHESEISDSNKPNCSFLFQDRIIKPLGVDSDLAKAFRDVGSAVFCTHNSSSGHPFYLNLAPDDQRRDVHKYERAASSVSESTRLSEKSSMNCCDSLSGGVENDSQFCNDRDFENLHTTNCNRSVSSIEEAEGRSRFVDVQKLLPEVKSSTISTPKFWENGKSLETPCYPVSRINAVVDEHSSQSLPYQSYGATYLSGDEHALPALFNEKSSENRAVDNAKFDELCTSQLYRNARLPFSGIANQNTFEKCGTYESQAMQGLRFIIPQ